MKTESVTHIELHLVSPDSLTNQLIARGYEQQNKQAKTEKAKNEIINAIKGLRYCWVVNSILTDYGNDILVQNSYSAYGRLFILPQNMMDSDHDRSIAWIKEKKSNNIDVLLWQLVWGGSENDPDSNYCFGIKYNGKSINGEILLPNEHKPILLFEVLLTKLEKYTEYFNSVDGDLLGEFGFSVAYKSTV